MVIAGVHAFQLYNCDHGVLSSHGVDYYIPMYFLLVLRSLKGIGMVYAYRYLPQSTSSVNQLTCLGWRVVKERAFTTSSRV